MFRRWRMFFGFLSLPFLCEYNGVALDRPATLSLSMESVGYTAEIHRAAGSSSDDSWLEGISVYLRTWKKGSPRIVGFNLDEHAIHVDGFESSVIGDESSMAGIAIDRFSSSNRERIAYYPLGELAALDSSSVGTLRGAPLSGNIAVMLFDHNARLVDEVWLGDSSANYSGNTDLWRGARLPNGEDIRGYVRTSSKNTRSAWDWRRVSGESTFAFPRIAEEIAREVALEFEVQSATAERAVLSLGHFPTHYLPDEIVVLDDEESLIARAPLREFRKGRVQLRAPGGVVSFSESEPDVVFELEAIVDPPLSTDSEFYFSVASEGEFELVPSVSAVAGQDRVRISVSPRDDSIIDGETLSIVRCWSPGYEVGELALYNRDDEVGELRIQRRPSFRRHYEGDGYSYGEYSVVLSEVATDPVVVRLESDGVLDIVDQVIVWPGSSVSDDVAFILPDDEFSVYRKPSYTSLITASVASWPRAESVLEIRENDLENQGAQLRIDSDVLREGETITGAFELALPTAEDVTFGIASNSTIQVSPSFVTLQRGERVAEFSLHYPEDDVSLGVVDVRLNPASGSAWFHQTVIRTLDNDLNIGKVVVAFEAGLAYAGASNLATLELWSTGFIPVPQAYNGEALVDIVSNIPGFEMTEGPEVLQFVDGRADLRTGFSRAVGDAKIRVTIDGQTFDSDPFVILDGDRASENVLDVSQAGVNGPVFVLHEVSDGDLEITVVDSIDGSRRRLTNVPRDARWMSVSPGGVFVYLGNSEFEIQGYEVLEGSLDLVWSRDLRNEEGLDDSAVCERLIYTNCGLVVVSSADAEGADLGEREFRVFGIQEDGVRDLWREEALAIDAQYEPSSMELVTASVSLVNSRARNEMRFWRCVGEEFEEVGFFQRAPDTLGTRNLAAKLENGMLGRWGWLMDSSRADGTRITGGNAGVYLDGSGAAMGYRDGWVGQFIQEEIGGSSRLIYEPGPKLFPTETQGAYSLADGGVAVFHGEPGTLTLLPPSTFEEKASDVWVELIPNEDGKGPRDPETDRPLQVLRYGNNGPDRADSALIRALDGTGWTDLDVGSLLPGQTGSFSIPFMGSDPSARVIAIIESETEDPDIDNNRAEGLLGVRLPPNGQILDEYLRSPELFAVSPKGATVVGVFRDRFGQAELTTLAVDSGEFVVEATRETDSAFSALAIDDQKHVFAQEVGSSTVVEYAIVEGDYVSLRTYEGIARNAKLTPATINESDGLVVVAGSDLFWITDGSLQTIRSPDDFVVSSAFTTDGGVWVQGDLGSVRTFARVVLTSAGILVEPVWDAPGFQIGYHAFGNYVIDRTWRLNLETGERIEHGIRDVVDWRRLLRYDDLGRYAVAKKDGLSRRFGVNPWSTAEQEYPGGIRVLNPHETIGRRIVGKSDRSGGGSLLLFESHFLTNDVEVDLEIDLIGSPEIVGVEGEFELVVELRNTGPGVAENVEVQFEASEEINWEIDESQGLTSLPTRAQLGNLGPGESIRSIYRGSLGHGVDPKVVTINALLLSSSMETDAQRNRHVTSIWRYPEMLSSRFELEGMDFEWTRPDRTEAIVTAMIRNRTTLFADVGEIPWESGPVLFRVNHSEFITLIEPIESDILVENIEAGQLYEIAWRVEVEEPGHRFFEVGWENGWSSSRTRFLGRVYLDTDVSGVGVDQEFARFTSDAVVNFLIVSPERGIVTATSMSPLEFVALNPMTLARSNPYACCESDLPWDPAIRLFEGFGDSIWLRRSSSKTIEELQPVQGIVRRIEHQETPFALSQSIGAPNIVATLSQVDSDIELGIYRDQDLIDERRWRFGSTDQSLTFLSPDRLLVTMGASVALLGIHGSEVMELDRVPTGIPFSNLQSTRDSVFAIPPSRIRVNNDQLTIEDLAFPPNSSTFVGKHYWFALDKTSESLAAYDLETSQVVWWKSLAPLGLGAAEVQRVGTLASGEDTRLVLSAAIDGSSFLTSTSLDLLEDYVPKLEMGESSDNFEFVLNGSGKLSLWVSLNRADYLHGADLEFSTSDGRIQFGNDSGEFVDRLRVPIDWNRDWQSYQVDYEADAVGSGSVEARFVVNSSSSDPSRYGIARWPITVFGAPRVRVTDLTYTEGEGLDTFWSLSHAPRVDHELSARVVATSEDARSFSVGQEIPLLIRRGSQDYQPSFPIHDDRILQAPATVEFEIQSNDAELSSNRFQLTILDNDLRSFRIVNDGNVEVDLQESAFSVWVVLDDIAPYPVRVRLRTVDGSASSGADYVGFEKWLRIPPGRLAVKAEIPIVADLQYEGGQENLYIELMEVENLWPGAIEEEFIIEDPKLVIQLEPSDGLGAVASFDSLIGLRYQAEIRRALSKEASWMPLGDALTGDGSRLRVHDWAQEGESQTFLRIWAFPTSGDE